MITQELAFDCSFHLLFRTVSNNVLVMQNLRLYLHSSRRWGQFHPTKSNRKLNFLRLWKKYFLALQTNLLPLLCQTCSLPSMFPLMPHSLSKQCPLNLFSSLGQEIYLNQKGDLIPRTVFLHSDSCFSMLWNSLKCLVLVKTLLASTNSVFFSVSVIDMLLYWMGIPSIPLKSHLFYPVGLHGSGRGTVLLLMYNIYHNLSAISHGTVMWE